MMNIIIIIMMLTMTMLGHILFNGHTGRMIDAAN